jgi:hypothetical protein
VQFRKSAYSILAVTFIRPRSIMCKAFAAASERSRTRPRVNGPRSLTTTMTLRCDRGLPRALSEGTCAGCARRQHDRCHHPFAGCHSEASRTRSRDSTFAELASRPKVPRKDPEITKLIEWTFLRGARPRATCDRLQAGSFVSPDGLTSIPPWRGNRHGAL